MPTEVPCPNCGRRVVWSAASPFRPFCSKRCKLIDLGEWLAENHRIPDTAPPEAM
ncbi:MAG TPA: DNA gyrase inhibitor YacG, partial [Lamprocystis sp. (in: g-proteobacteria)]|nr:DNA gyrase inhibitor YacG [Lamprocystis sp. (in: g-proteobacteria)]